MHRAQGHPPKGYEPKDRLSVGIAVERCQKIRHRCRGEAHCRRRNRKLPQERSVEALGVTTGTYSCRRDVKVFQWNV